ncbi:MAG: hypothetical protein WD468_12245 [Pirellulales bacterium]
MSRFPSFVMGAVVGALLLYAAMKYHVIRARDGFHFVSKQPPRLSETYADIRGYSPSDWAGRPQLASALVGANQQLLLGDSAADAVQNGIDQLLPSWPETP